MAKLVFPLLLFSAVTFVLLRGQREERLVACTLLLVAVGTGLLYRFGGQGFATISLPLILNEAILLGVTLTIAYRSRRFWPMPVASLELAAFLSLFAPLFGRNLVSYALGVTQGVWAYFQLLILVLAVIRGQNSDRKSKRVNT